MKITDKGLKHIISLGGVSKSSVNDVYTLYSWDGLTYYCGSKESFESSDLEGVYIELSESQLTFTSPSFSINSKTESDDKFSLALNFFETAVLLKVSEDKRDFEAVLASGNHLNLKNLNVECKENTPLRVVKESLKPFHGFYSPLAPFDEMLTKLGVNTHNLWMTAVPILKNNVLNGILLCLSSGTEYGIDVFESLNECIEKNNLAA